MFLHTFSGSRSPVAVCWRAALLIGLPPLLSGVSPYYREFTSDFHGGERPRLTAEHRPPHIPFLCLNGLDYPSLVHNPAQASSIVSFHSQPSFRLSTTIPTTYSCPSPLGPVVPHERCDLPSVISRMHRAVAYNPKPELHWSRGPGQTFTGCPIY